MRIWNFFNKCDKFGSFFSMENPLYSLKSYFSGWNLATIYILVTFLFFFGLSLVTFLLLFGLSFELLSLLLPYCPKGGAVLCRLFLGHEGIMKGTWVSQGSPEIRWLCVHGKYDYGNIVFGRRQKVAHRHHESQGKHDYSHHKSHLERGSFLICIYFLYSFACGLSLGNFWIVIIQLHQISFFFFLVLLFLLALSLGWKIIVEPLCLSLFT